MAGPGFSTLFSSEGESPLLALFPTGWPVSHSTDKIPATVTLRPGPPHPRDIGGRGCASPGQVAGWSQGHKGGGPVLNRLTTATTLVANLGVKPDSVRAASQ